MAHDWLVSLRSTAPAHSPTSASAAYSLAPRFVPRLAMQGGFPLTPRRDLPSLHPGFSLRLYGGRMTRLIAHVRLLELKLKNPPPRVSRRHAPSLSSPFCLRLLVVQSSCSLCSVYAALRHCAQVREKIAQLVTFGLWGLRDGDDDGIPLNPQRYYTIGVRLHWACGRSPADRSWSAFGAARQTPSVVQERPFYVHRGRGNPVVVAVA